MWICGAGFADITHIHTCNVSYATFICRDRSVKLPTPTSVVSLLCIVQRISCDNALVYLSRTWRHTRRKTSPQHTLRKTTYTMQMCAAHAHLNASEHTHAQPKYVVVECSQTYTYKHAYANKHTFRHSA